MGDFDPIKFNHIVCKTKRLRGFSWFIKFYRHLMIIDPW